MPPKRRETGETSGDPSRSPKRRRGDQPGGSQGSSPNPNNGDAFHRQLYNIGPREEGKSRLETDPAKSSNLDRYRQPYSHGKHTRFGENNTETVLKDTEDDIREYHEDNNLKTFLADATDPIQHDATVPIEPNATVTKHIKYIYIDKLEPEDRQKPQTVTRIITRDDGTKTRSAEYFQYTDNGLLRFVENYEIRENRYFRLNKSAEHLEDGSKTEKRFFRKRDNSLIYTITCQYGPDGKRQWETHTNHGENDAINYERHTAYGEDRRTIISNKYIRYTSDGKEAYSEIQHFRPDGRLEWKQHTDARGYQFDQRFRYRGDGSLKLRERSAYENEKLQWKDQFKYTRDGQIQSETFSEYKNNGAKASYTRKYEYTEDGEFQTITIDEVTTKEDRSRTETRRVDNFKYTEDGEISIEVIETGADGEETWYERKPRPREEGMIELGDLPTGPHNAFTDGGGKVGHMTLNDDARDIHTGATFYKLDDSPNPWGKEIPCACARVHGNGNATGLEYIREYGRGYPIVATTGTTDIGNVLQGGIQHATENGVRLPYPVVLETYNGYTHKVETRPIKDRDVVKAINEAKGGFVPEGSVGGGNSNYSFEFVAGFGNSSRVVIYPNGRRFIIVTGAQCNQSKREELVVDGVPLGKEIGYEEVKGIGLKVVPGLDLEGELKPVKSQERSSLVIIGSIRKVGSTEGGISANQCKQMAKRLLLSQGRLGEVRVREGSGDFNLVFSPRKGELPDDDINLVYDGFIQAGAESILNAIWAGTQIKGNDIESDPLPHNRVNEVMLKHGKKRRKPGVPDTKEIYGLTKQHIDEHADEEALDSDSDASWDDSDDSSGDEGGPDRPGGSGDQSGTRRTGRQDDSARSRPGSSRHTSEEPGEDTSPSQPREKRKAAVLENVASALASPALQGRTRETPEPPASKQRRVTASTPKRKTGETRRPSTSRRGRGAASTPTPPRRTRSHGLQD